MRRRPTKSEREFSCRLDAAGITYKTQMILGFYLLDFVFPEKLLVIEIDGRNHDYTRDYDRKRDNFIRRCGLEVLRIKNAEAVTFDLALISDMPSRPEESFRSALGMGSALKSKEMTIQRRTSGTPPLLFT